MSLELLELDIQEKGRVKGMEEEVHVVLVGGNTSLSSYQCTHLHNYSIYTG